MWYQMSSVLGQQKLWTLVVKQWACPAVLCFFSQTLWFTPSLLSQRSACDKGADQPPFSQHFVHDILATVMDEQYIIENLY